MPSCLNAKTGQLFYAGDPCGVHRTAVGPDDGLGQGVGGKDFGMGRRLQHLFSGKGFLGCDRFHAELAGSEGSRFIENDGTCFVQSLQVVAALDQNSLPGGPADTREKPQGNGDHQCAGAGDHQKDQGPVNPVFEQAAEKDGRDKCHQRSQAHHRGV